MKGSAAAVAAAGVLLFGLAPARAVAAAPAVSAAAGGAARSGSTTGGAAGGGATGGGGAGGAAGTVPGGGAATAEAEGAARAAAEAAAAVRATQDLESAVIQLRRELEALRTAREATGDLRRRLEAVEARLEELGRVRSLVAPGLGTGEGDSVLAPDGGGSEDLHHFRDDRFVIRSADGFHALEPRLHIAPRLEAARADSVPPYGQRSSVTPALRWAQVGFEGYAHARAFEYRAELELAGAAPAILDVFGQLRLQTRFVRLGVRAGRVRVPYGFQPSDLLDGRGLTLTDLAAASAAYGLGRDTGLMLIGETQGRRLLLRAAMLQGGALERGGAPAALAWGARVLAVPLGVWSAVEGDLNRRGHLALGASVYTTSRATDIVACSGVDPLFDPGLIRGLEDRDGDGRIDGVRVVQAAGELHLAWRGVALSGEYFHRWERPDGTGERRWSNGGYVQASAFVLPRALEVAGRIGRTNLPLYGASAVERALAGRRRDEQALAMTAYLRGHDLKLQAEYAHLVDDDVRADPITGPPFDRTAHRLRLQAHLAF